MPCSRETSTIVGFVFFFFLNTCIAATSPPKLPTQFSAKINITAHNVDREKDYPPWLKKLEVWYDFDSGRFRAEFKHTSRTAIRRYDKSKEFLVSRVDGAVHCQVSKLKDQMPEPEWPQDAVFEESEVMEGRVCNRWRVEGSGVGGVDVVIHIEEPSGALVRVQAETIEQIEPVRLTRPDITYDVYKFRFHSPSASKFNLPKDVKGGEVTCERQPNDIGFPYIHFFHYYYRA
mmetsp:Transcript_5504/g.7441  ORF Transcript_5504/g.7441 Transcript_5504/m.7441 type:complete len:232 (-) Transcript_5504:145-840(-)